MAYHSEHWFCVVFLRPKRLTFWVPQLGRGLRLVHAASDTPQSRAALMAEIYTKMIREKDVQNKRRLSAMAFQQKMTKMSFVSWLFIFLELVWKFRGLTLSVLDTSTMLDIRRQVMQRRGDRHGC